MSVFYKTVFEKEEKKSKVIFPENIWNVCNVWQVKENCFVAFSHKCGTCFMTIADIIDNTRLLWHLSTDKYVL